MGATGCIYAMRRELAAPLPEGTLNDDMYLPLEAFFRGYRVILDDSALAFDYPTPLASEFRRKVRTLAGVYQIVGSYPALLGPRNRMWIHFFSHKLARLVMPWAMIVAAGASVLACPRAGDSVAIGAAGRRVPAGAVGFLDARQFPPQAFDFPHSHLRGVDGGVALRAGDLFVPASVLWKETRVSGDMASTTVKGSGSGAASVSSPPFVPSCKPSST